MGKDSIDASVGLAFSLELFSRYHRTGILQAEMSRLPGISGRCQAYLHLIDGVVVSCYVEDRRGQRYSFSKDILCHVDSERGPFEWSFRALSAPSPKATTSPLSLPPPAQQLSPSLLPVPTVPQERFQRSGPLSYPVVQGFSIPAIVSLPEWNRLNSWTLQQKRALSMVMARIDGRRTVDDIKACTPLPPEIVEEALRILLALKVAVIFS